MCFPLACVLDIASSIICVIVQEGIDLTTSGLGKEAIFASLIDSLSSLLNSGL